MTNITLHSIGETVYVKVHLYPVGVVRYTVTGIYTNINQENIYALTSADGSGNTRTCWEHNAYDNADDAFDELEDEHDDSEASIPTVI